MKRAALSIIVAAGLFSAAEAATYQLAVEGLVCPLCAYSVERELGRIAGVEKIDIDFRTGIAVVTTEDGVALDRETAKRAIDKAGFALTGFEEVIGQ